MTNSNVELKKQGKSSILGGISIAIAVILAALVINFLTGLVPLEKIQGLPIIMPFIIAPIGAVIGFVGYQMNKDTWSLWGIILNIVMFLVPIVYNVVAILFFGV